MKEKKIAVKVQQPGEGGIEPTVMVVISKGVIGPESVKIMYLKSPNPVTRAIGEMEIL